MVDERQREVNEGRTEEIYNKLATGTSKRMVSHHLIIMKPVATLPEFGKIARILKARWKVV